MTSRINVTREGHVLSIGVNRPEKRNAFDVAMLADLAAAYTTLAEDPGLRVGVVHAVGDHFSAGLDLAVVGPEVVAKGTGVLHGFHPYDPFGVWAAQVPKPIVIAVNGISYTLTIELALAADIVVAADDVRFRQLEIGRGILPFAGATMRAPAQLGWGNAMRFLLTAEEFGAAEALRIGLAQEVVPAGQHVERAHAIARLVAKQSPSGVRGTLANAREAAKNGFEAAQGHMAAMLPSILTGADAKEGLQSFLERREARFED